MPVSSRYLDPPETNQERQATDTPDNRMLIEMTAQIVAAYLSRNTVPAVEVPQVIAAVRQGLSGLGSEGETERAHRPEPAVPVKSSVGRDSITCLICGRRQKMLKRHILIAHGLTPAEYRQNFGLRSDYPMTAPSYAKKRSQLARQFGLGVRGKAG